MGSGSDRAQPDDGNTATQDVHASTDTTDLSGSPRAPQHRRGSGVGWTWTWGDLPMKTSDPSLADLRSLTDIALRERGDRRTPGVSNGRDMGADDASGEAHTSSGQVADADLEQNLDITSDGKPYAQLAPGGVKGGMQDSDRAAWCVEFREGEGCGSFREGGRTPQAGIPSSRCVDTGDMRNPPTSVEAVAGQESRLSSRKSSVVVDVRDDLSIDDAGAININDRPDPKDAPHSNSSDFRQLPSSPSSRHAVDKQEHPEKPSLKFVPVQASTPPAASSFFRNRASQVASALGSDRTLSLCAHILSSTGSDAPHTVDDLRRVLTEFQVSPEQFAATPLEVLNNPTLVVVTNGVLIPWRLVHENLMANSKLQHQQDSDGRVCAQDTPLFLGPSQSGEGDRGEEYSRLLRFAGVHVTMWDSYMASLHHQSDASNSGGSRSATATPRESLSDVIGAPDSGGSVHRLELESGSEAALNVPPSRRGSYRSTTSNDDVADFDLMECFSETSTATGLIYRDTVDGEDGEEACYHGANVWSREALDWNSVDDFQRLLNECARQDSVPDLLKPYVTSVSNSLWEEDDYGVDQDRNMYRADDLDESSSSAATAHSLTQRSRSTVTNAMEQKSGALLQQSEQKVVPSKSSLMPLPLVSSSAAGSTLGMSVSMSHDTGLDRMAQVGALPMPTAVHDATKRGEKVSIKTQDTPGEEFTSRHFSSLDSLDDKSLPPQEDADYEDENVMTNDDFLSLHDISHDDILPGPARGDVYDGSDTDSFYSLSLDDGDAGQVSAAGAASTANDEKKRLVPRKYLYRKTLVPTQAQIQAMELQDGQNEIVFEVEVCGCTSYIDLICILRDMGRISPACACMGVYMGVNVYA